MENNISPTENKPQRKIFNYDNPAEFTISKDLNIYENNISACGCVFYRIKNKTLQLLLIKYESEDWPRLDDFGGQIDLNDENINQAMSRELAEESNYIINIDVEKSKFLEKTYFYNKKSKYYFCAIYVDNYYYDDTTVFGDVETTDNIKRTIKWYNYSDLSIGEIDKGIITSFPPKPGSLNLAYRLGTCKSFVEFLDLHQEALIIDAENIKILYKQINQSIPQWLIEEAKTIIEKHQIDNSHGFEHYALTWSYAKQILDEEFNSNTTLIEGMSCEDSKEVVLLSAFIHDRVDGKYMNMEEEINLFSHKAVSQGLSVEKVDAIIYIISHMSYSKRIKRINTGLPLLEDNKYKLVLGIVIDADQLEGYRIDRILEYQSHYYKNVNNFEERWRLIRGWCKTILVKRLLSYKDNFMNTETGKKLCLPMHNQTEKYIARFFPDDDMFEY